MRTVVVSDLHIGSRQRRDLLRSPAFSGRLLDAMSGADQLVLLGDALELRDLPFGRVLSLAQPLLSALGTALRGGRIVLVPGNHDHQLAAPVLHGPGVLGVGREAPARGGAAGAVALALGHTDVVVAYPGFWIRPDVWATHGHYMDAHTAAATFECLTAAVMQGARLHRRPPRCAEDYERVVVPLYTALYELAQRPKSMHAASAAKRLLRVAEQRARTSPAITAELELEGDGGWASVAMAVLGGASVRSGLTPGETRRPGLGPLAAVLRTLEVDAAFVVFGHTHRAVQVAPTTRCGSHLTNTGSWVVESGRQSPDAEHTPGVVIVVESAGPPRVERLIENRDLA